MVLSYFLLRIAGDKSDPHGVIPISFNSHSTLTAHFYTFFKLQSETYTVVTRSKTKAVGTQMPKVHEAHKIVDPALNPHTQARREGIPKPILLTSESESQPPRIMSPVLPRKRAGKTGARRKTTRTKLQPTPQPQPSLIPQPIVPCRPEPPPTAIPCLGERPLP